MITVIDYDAGNLKSVQKALEFLGEEVVVSRAAKDILAADGIILPGVGAFGEAMEKLHNYDLVEPIRQAVQARIPFLGICLGLQLLFERSDESEGVPGLGILQGEILRIPAAEDLKIPHIGWNSLHLENNGRLFTGIKENAYVYFVHSFYLKAKETQIVKASTEYGTHIHASVEQDNVFACQFHPEKSGETGLQILRNFAALTHKQEER